VFVVAYRRNVLTNSVQSRCRTIIEGLASGFSVRILEYNGEADHIHMLIKVKPQSQISKFVNSAKTVTSRLLKKEFPGIKKKLWQHKFWSRSYFVSSVGESTVAAVKTYIQDQKK